MQRRSKQGTILLVEDNPDDVALTQRALNKARIANKVVVVGSGPEALEYLRRAGGGSDPERDGLPEVVLLDLKLPGMDGLEVLRRLRANRRTRLLPVVVLSSSTEDRDLMSSYELGVNSYIRKPVDFKQFVKTVQELGQYWLALNQPPPA